MQANSQYQSLKQDQRTRKSNNQFHKLTTKSWWKEKLQTHFKNPDTKKKKIQFCLKGDEKTQIKRKQLEGEKTICSNPVNDKGQTKTVYPYIGREIPINLLPQEKVSIHGSDIEVRNPLHFLQLPLQLFYFPVFWQILQCSLLGGSGTRYFSF